MSYWDNYTEIEGLQFQGDHELSYESYQYDLVGVWHGEEGYYVGTDSGCSCPTPWEWLGGIDELTGPMTYSQMVESVRQSAERNQYNSATGEYDLVNINLEDELMEWLDGLKVVDQ